MKARYSNLMQSRFFSPAFNSAIFDGPVRIYFSQIHESLALKIYFSLQQKFPEVIEAAKELHKIHGQNVLVMLYPTFESFELSFESAGPTSFLVEDHLDDDFLLGINGPFEDSQLEIVLEAIVQNLRRAEVPRALEQSNGFAAEL